MIVLLLNIYNNSQCDEFQHYWWIEWIFYAHFLIDNFRMKDGDLWRSGDLSYVSLVIRNANGTSESDFNGFSMEFNGRVRCMSTCCAVEKWHADWSHHYHFLSKYSTSSGTGHRTISIKNFLSVHSFPFHLNL